MQPFGEFLARERIASSRYILHGCRASLTAPSGSRSAVVEPRTSVGNKIFGCQVNSFPLDEQFTSCSLQQYKPQPVPERDIRVLVNGDTVPGRKRERFSVETSPNLLPRAFVHASGRFERVAGELRAVFFRDKRRFVAIYDFES